MYVETDLSTPKPGAGQAASPSFAIDFYAKKNCPWRRLGMQKPGIVVLYQVHGNLVRRVWVGDDEEELTTKADATEDDIVASACFQSCMECMTEAGLRGTVSLHYHNYNKIETWG
eukprot:g3171.t1